MVPTATAMSLLVNTNSPAAEAQCEKRKKQRTRCNSNVRFASINGHNDVKLIYLCRRPGLGVMWRRRLRRRKGSQQSPTVCR